MRRLGAILLLLISSPAAWGDIYTWKDIHGTSHYTNSLHEIPSRYLKKARVVDIATGKKGALVTAQPPQGTQTPVPGQPPQQVPATAPPAGNALAVPGGPAPAMTSPSGNAMVVNPSSTPPPAASNAATNPNFNVPLGPRHGRRRASPGRTHAGGEE